MSTRRQPGSFHKAWIPATLPSFNQHNSPCGCHASSAFRLPSLSRCVPFPSLCLRWLLSLEPPSVRVQCLGTVSPTVCDRWMMMYPLSLHPGDAHDERGNDADDGQCPRLPAPSHHVAVVVVRLMLEVRLPGLPSSSLVDPTSSQRVVVCASFWILVSSRLPGRCCLLVSPSCCWTARDVSQDLSDDLFG